MKTKTIMCKRSFIVAMAIVFNLLCGLNVMATNSGSTKDEDKNDVNASKAVSAQQKRVLVTSLANNVHSNYFYDGMISEETGIPKDSIASYYNNVVAKYIAENLNRSGKYACDANCCIPCFENARMKGEDEEAFMDAESVKANDLKASCAGNADYIVVINQHYLKWQDKPMNTLFHFVCYSVFDKNMKEISHDKAYFTSMALEKPARFEKSSRKGAQKIASTILKEIK